jgi:membrane associated rhomboid family serine protease
MNIINTVTSIFGYNDAIYEIPFFSGFAHAGYGHVFSNLIVIFFCLLANINKFYTIEKIFWITTLLSTIFLIPVLIGITDPIIGISGTCFFLMTRFFLSVKRNIKISQFFIFMLIYIETIHAGNDDQISHSMHIAGFILGWISLHPYKFQLVPRFIYDIIS